MLVQMEHHCYVTRWACSLKIVVSIPFQCLHFSIQNAGSCSGCPPHPHWWEELHPAPHLPRSVLAGSLELPAEPWGWKGKDLSALLALEQTRVMQNVMTLAYLRFVEVRPVFVPAVSAEMGQWHHWSSYSNCLAMMRGSATPSHGLPNPVQNLNIPRWTLT